MLTIRLTRKGKKNQPFFKIVVVDKKRSAKGGRAVDILGYLDPLTKRKSIKKERVLHWLKVGAKASPTVHNLLVAEKVIEAKKIQKHRKPKNKEGEGTQSASAAGVAAPAAPAETPVAEPAKTPDIPVAPEKTAERAPEPLKTEEKPPEKPA